MSDSFFVSDSLKDVIDEQMLIDVSVDMQVQEFGETDISGNFVALSLAEKLMTLEVNQKIVKSLLANPHASFTISFMNEIWILSSEDMKLKHEKEGKYHATLRIIDRRKEDTYERTI